MAPVKEYGWWEDAFAFGLHFPVFRGTDLEYLVNDGSVQEKRGQKRGMKYFKPLWLVLHDVHDGIVETFDFFAGGVGPKFRSVDGEVALERHDIDYWKEKSWMLRVEDW